MRCIAFLLTAGISFAQQVAAPAGAASETKAVLTYTGAPLQVKANCRPEDIVALGLACTEDDPCQLFLELTDAEVVGSRVLTIGNLHTSATTLESVVLVSEDGGRTWTEPAARILGGGLDQIQFTDFEHGWISGQMLLALPRDAFFLISSDGGKTWRKRPVFSEPRVGSIESFWFESKSSGSMTVDRLQSADNGMRYELYESMTGGDSWTLRQVGAKPIAARRRTGERDVRLRADGPTKTYRLEKRTASDWELLATFMVSAGECKPPETAPLPEPPAVSEAPAPSSPAPSPAAKSPRRR